VELVGSPIKIADLLIHLPGAYYVTRQSVHDANAVRKLKKAFVKSFQYQKEKKGTCFVEVVSNCPSGWRMTPVESIKYLEEHMFPAYPLGDMKKPDGA
jgi:2-oxoglutarate ferredoxin oxidoreductase subunit beta